MRSAILLPLLVGFGASAFVTMLQTPATAMPERAVVSKPSISQEMLLDIVSYDDDIYGFTVAVPSGWQKVVPVEIPEDYDVLEPGYAVGFEAPKEAGLDQFTDYIMIEIMPGNDSGAFETDGSQRVEVIIDGRPAWIDIVAVNASDLGLDDVELTVYQAQIKGLGFTVGLYAIGEPGRDKLMSAAFELIVRTFSFFVEPYETA